MNPLLNFNNYHFANLASPILSGQLPLNITSSCFLENWYIHDRLWPCNHGILATMSTKLSSLTRNTVKTSIYIISSLEQ